MVTTRKVISPDYIKQTSTPTTPQPTCPVKQPTCPAGSTRPTETRRVISPEYIKPTGVPYNGRTITRTPITSSYPRAIHDPVYVAPRPIVSRPVIVERPVYVEQPPVYVQQPVFVAQPTPPPPPPVISQPVYVTPPPAHVATSGADIAEAILFTAAVVGIVALIVIAPYCYKEEVCETISAGLAKCHIEEVCTTLWDRMMGT